MKKELLPRSQSAKWAAEDDGNPFVQLILLLFVSDWDNQMLEQETNEPTCDPGTHSRKRVVIQGGARSYVSLFIGFKLLVWLNPKD